MQQKIIFDRGIDSDTSPEAFQEGVGRFRIGVRVMNSNDGEAQAAELVAGNIKIDYSLPFGDNKVVGAFEYELTQKVYYFVFNSYNNHSILEYDAVADIVSCVFSDSILNFQPDVIITGINVIELDKGNHLLYWSDGWINPSDVNDFNEPKKINIEKGKFYMAGDYVNGYKSPFDPEILYRIKKPPLCAPDVSWSGLDSQEGAFKASNDTAQVLIGFGGGSVGLQFDNDYYDPNFEFDAATGEWTVGADGEYFISSEVYFITHNNNSPVNISYAVLELMVDGVPVADSFLFAQSGSILVSKIITLSQGNVVTVNGSVLSPRGGAAIFKGVSFKSNLNSTDLNEVNRLFKRNFQFQSQFIYDDFEISVLSSMSNFILPKTKGSSPTGEDIISQDNLLTVRVSTGSSIVRKIRIVAKDVDSSLYSIVATIDKDELNILDNTVYEYEFTNDVLGIPLDPDDSVRLMDWVPLSSKSQELIKGIRLTDGLITENFDPVSVDMRISLDYEFLTRNDNAHFPAVQNLKSGQSYAWGVEYQDHGGRIGSVNLTEGDYDNILQNGLYGTTLNIPFLTESTYNPNFVYSSPSKEMDYVPKVGVELYHEPPVWATKWKLIRSKGQSMGRYLQFAAQQISFRDAAGNSALAPVATSMVVDIENISGIYLSENNLSTLAYSFDKGDRIRFIANKEGVSPSYNDLQPFLAHNDSPIESYDDLTGTLIVQLNDTNTVLRTIGWGVLFEIYHPISGVVDNREFLYEVAECGDVITLGSGRRAHVSKGSTQGYFIFSDNYYSNGKAGFQGIGVSGFSVGDKVKIVQYPGFTNPEYNTYSTVTAIVNLGGLEVVVTDIPFGASTPAEGGVMIKASVIDVNSGDCFRRYSNMPLIDGGATKRLYSYIEASSASNMFSSEFYDYGRPNIVDDEIKRITRPASIRYSKKFIPETFINGLSSVNGLSFEEYDLFYGGIYKLFYINQTLKMFQELKIGSIPVAQILYSDASGNQVVGISEKVLSPQVIYYKGEYGIGQHPESFAWYGAAGYGIDVKRGVQWRLANDGLTPISKLYKMDSYYTNKCADILTSSSRVRILGAYDVDFGEYVVAFDSYKNGSGNDVVANTLAFNEEANQFSTFHFYQPEMLVSSGIGLVSFKDGAIYKHGANSLYNNFYGVQYKAQLEFYCNIGSSKVKVFEALSLECKDTWNVVIETPVTGQNPNGQHTEMTGANFVIKEGFPYVDILKDDYTPNIVAGAPYLPDARFTGNPLRGVYALVKLEFQESSYTKIWACNVLVIPSERSAR